MTKLYLLSDYADQIRGTVYNQTLFAELEKTIDESVEKGEALTAEFMCKLTEDLYSRYLGSTFSPHPLYKINWCRIPHFYYNFYVYQYVTGFSAAASLSQKILAGDTSARDAYIDFLSKGSSNYSVNLLRDAGVDMSKPQPIEAATELLNNILNEIETLID
jgi:oligoendopeptidase F